MPSKLIRSALKSVPEAGRRTLARLGVWLKSCRAAAEQPTDGRKILKNLLGEAHLVGEAAFDDGTELSAFLQCCAERFSPTLKPTEYYPYYEEACAKFEGRGLRVQPEHLPDRILRYSTSVRLLKRLVEPHSILARAEVEVYFDESPEAAFEFLCSNWDPYKVSAIKLGDDRRKTIFATFEQEHTVLDRNNATAVYKALALFFSKPPLPTGEGILFEFSYLRDAVKHPRFPTIADAGWNSSFQPAVDEAPNPREPRTWWGWTRPVGPYPPQPEIVHENASVSIVKDRPRWVGRIRR